MLYQLEYIGCLNCFKLGVPLEAENLKRLRIVLTSIRKERLLDISEEDAKKEGFEDNVELICAFCKIYKSSCPKNLRDHLFIRDEKDEKYGSNGTVVYVILQEWNPEVWVLSFSVKGADK